MSVWWSKNGHFPVVQVSLVHQSYFKSLDGLLLKAFHFQHESFLWTGNTRGVVLRHPGSCEADLNSTASVDTNTAELAWPVCKLPAAKTTSSSLRRSQAKQAEPEQKQRLRRAVPDFKHLVHDVSTQKWMKSEKTKPLWASCFFNFEWFTWTGSRCYKP